MDLKLAAQTMFAAIATAVPDSKVVFTYGGEVYQSAIRGSINAERSVSLYGELAGYNYSVWVPADYFATPLAGGKICFIGDDERLIMGTSVDPVNGLTRCDIGDVNG